MYYNFETLVFLFKTSWLWKYCTCFIFQLEENNSQILPFVLVDTVACYIIHIADTKYQFWSGRCMEVKNITKPKPKLLLQTCFFLNFSFYHRRWFQTSHSSRAQRNPQSAHYPSPGNSWAMAQSRPSSLQEPHVCKRSTPRAVQLPAEAEEEAKYLVINTFCINQKGSRENELLSNNKKEERFFPLSFFL